MLPSAHPVHVLPAFGQPDSEMAFAGMYSWKRFGVFQMPTTMASRTGPRRRVSSSLRPRPSRRRCRKGPGRRGSARRACRGPGIDATDPSHTPVVARHRRAGRRRARLEALSMRPHRSSDARRHRGRAEFEMVALAAAARQPRQREVPSRRARRARAVPADRLRETREIDVTLFIRLVERHHADLDDCPGGSRRDTPVLRHVLRERPPWIAVALLRQSRSRRANSCAALIAACRPSPVNRVRRVPRPAPGEILHEAPRPPWAADLSSGFPSHRRIAAYPAVVEEDHRHPVQVEPLAELRMDAAHVVVVGEDHEPHRVGVQEIVGERLIDT